MYVCMLGGMDLLGQVRYVCTFVFASVCVYSHLRARACIQHAGHAARAWYTTHTSRRATGGAQRRSHAHTSIQHAQAMQHVHGVTRARITQVKLAELNITRAHTLS